MHGYILDISYLIFLKYLVLLTAATFRKIIWNRKNSNNEQKT